MKVRKFLSVSAFITCFSLLYVYQQTEIFRLAYVGQKNQASFEDLLDKNSILRYNKERNASLVYIGDRILGGGEFQLPDTYHLVRLSPPKENLKIKTASLNKQQPLFSRIFSIKRQAEAKTINP
jgi:hypothetical protein